MRALVIDDDPDVLALVCAMLERLGHETRGAGDGIEGFKLFAAWLPDLVFTDMIMPGAEGLETIRAIKQHGHPATIVAMSGMRSKHVDMLACAAALGADQVLAKPFDFQEFTALMQRIESAPPSQASA